MQETCNKLGYCNISEAFITKDFNFKAQYVIHILKLKYSDIRRTYNYTNDVIEKIG